MITTYRVVGSEIASANSSKSSRDSCTASSYRLKLLNVCTTLNNMMSQMIVACTAQHTYTNKTKNDQ